MENRKIAIVTGGSRGLGKNIALALAKKGLDIILTYNSKKEEAEKVKAEIELTGCKAVIIQLSVDVSAGFDHFAKEIAQILNLQFQKTHFDFLINNAGVGIHATYDETTEAQLESMFKIHVNAPFFLAQKLSSQLNRGGGIVNISTGLTRFTSPIYSAYATMKGAVETLTKYQASHFGARGIRVNVIAPGPIETDFGGGAIRDNPEINKKMAENTALGRVGLPEDIGGVVAFLCSDESKWVNAQRIEISGGINL